MYPAVRPNRSAGTRPQCDVTTVQYESNTVTFLKCEQAFKDCLACIQCTPSDGHIAGSAALWILTTVPHAGMKYHSESWPLRALMSPPAATHTTVTSHRACDAEQKREALLRICRTQRGVRLFVWGVSHRCLSQGSTGLYTPCYLVPPAAWC